MLYKCHFWKGGKNKNMDHHFFIKSASLTRGGQTVKEMDSLTF